MKATDVLREEHQAILGVLTALERMTEAFLKAGKLEREPAAAAVDFIRTFADACHHGKEEDRLFPAMEARGFPKHGGPTAVMRSEHEHGRVLVRAMASAVEEDKLDEFARAARAFVPHLRQHIEKEDHCLFPMADEALGNDGQAALLAEFQKAEAEHGAGTHEKYLGVADALRIRYGVAPAAAQSCGRACGCGG